MMQSEWLAFVRHGANVDDFAENEIRSLSTGGVPLEKWDKMIPKRVAHYGDYGMNKERVPFVFDGSTWKKMPTIE